MAKKGRKSLKKKAGRSGNQEKVRKELIDWWARIPASYQHLIALVFLIVVPAFLFSEVYSGRQQFVAHDIQQFLATAKSVMSYQDQTGEDALWASNIFSGMPSYTVIGNKAFVHLDTLLRRLFPAMFIPVFPFIFCVGGAYFLFWLMGCRPLPSALGALAIALTTYIPIIVGAGHNSKLIAWSWMPWVVSGYWMLSRGRWFLPGLFVFTIALNFALRAEHIQVVYYFLFPLGIWFLYDTVTAWRHDSIMDWTRRAGLLFLSGLLALAANIQPYWSIYEYSAFSIRGGSEITEMTSPDELTGLPSASEPAAETGSPAGETPGSRRSGGLDMNYAFAWSQGRTELLTLIIPGIFGGSSADAVTWQRSPVTSKYWGPKSFTSGPHYLGAIVFLMFLIGLIRAPGRLKFVFLGSGLLTMLFSLGENFYHFNALFFHYMPLFNKFRTPEMWLIVTVFCFSVIAVMGMKWICESHAKGTLDLRSLFLPGGIAFAIALFFALSAGSVFSFEKEGEREQLTGQIARQENLQTDNPQLRQFVGRIFQESVIPQRQEKAVSDSWRFLLFIVLGSGLLILTARRIIPANYAMAGLVLLAAVDLVQVGGRYADKGGLIDAGASPHDAVTRSQRSVDRYIIENKQDGQLWPYRTFPLGDSPFNNAVPATYYYPSIGGYSGAKLSHYQDVIDFAIFTRTGSINTEVLNMLNTRFLTYPFPVPDLPDWEVVHQGNIGVVMENPEVLPKAWFVDSVKTVSGASEAIEALKRFNAATTAIVMGPAEPRQVETSEPDTRQVRITEYGPREIRMDLQTDGSSFLVLSEIWYPEGWYAWLNDEPVDIIRTNYILRGFDVPAGQHELKLRFDPRSHILGSRLSRLFNIIILLIGFTALYQHLRVRRQTPKNDTNDLRDPSDTNNLKLAKDINDPSNPKDRNDTRDPNVSNDPSGKKS